MVDQRARLSAAEQGQAEYIDTMQVTSSEEEAHELIQRHLQRSLPDSTAVVLQRNNSANRLQAATALDPGSELATRLVGAEPRSCLALRFARTHREGPALTPLLSCLLYAATAAGRNRVVTASTQSRDPSEAEVGAEGLLIAQE